MDASASQDLTSDALTDRVRVTQRRGGHRYSFDDVVTAWVAARAAPNARRYLDLGCGLGSVLLMVADRLRDVRALGIEAQAESFALARHNVGQSWLAERVRLSHGDLRDESLCGRAREDFAAFASGRERADVVEPAGECAEAWRGFDLVTGTPPYKKPGTATPSPDPQRAHARIELRGGIEDYLATAAKMLAPEGTCVVCMESEGLKRVETGARDAGLEIVARLDVIPIAGGKGRLFSVFTLRHMQLGADQRGALNVSDLLLRDASGARTEAALELRRFFGLEDPTSEPPSPPKVRQ
jgi:tRNA1Val (adenine37-N6)-methyltransferase